MEERTPGEGFVRKCEFRLCETSESTTVPITECVEKGQQCVFVYDKDSLLSHNLNTRKKTDNSSFSLFIMIIIMSFFIAHCTMGTVLLLCVQIKKFSAFQKYTSHTFVTPLQIWRRVLVYLSLTYKFQITQNYFWYIQRTCCFRKTDRERVSSHTFSIWDWQLYCIY